MIEPTRPDPPIWVKCSLFAYVTLVVIAAAVPNIWKGVVPLWMVMLATVLAFPLSVMTFPRPDLKTWQIVGAVAVMLALAICAVSLQWCTQG
jgi:hypothetical protein